MKNKKPLLATWLLLFATFFWGISFLTMQALVMTQNKLLPDANTWFLSSLSLVFRFGVAVLFLVCWKFSSLKQMTWLEFYEGVVLGVVGGIGLLLQMDGVNYTSAPTSAFLTQCYCILIPLVVAFQKRAWPSPVTAISILMVCAGVLTLSEFGRLGRGEIETLLATIFFTGQILWLERPLFSSNNPLNYTVVMFVVTALIFVPIPLWTGGPAKIALAYSSWPAVAFSLILAVFCTLIAYTLMNYWQPHVEATQAGLIYCCEPVFTSIFALFIPGWFSAFAAINFPNEVLSLRQLIGGGLITAANVLIIVQAAKASRSASKSDAPS